ncbi:MAG: hypothetical protein K9M54_11475, partial [Kiritimatiellales bacterium]|nr:hypothetical protein [Kiritimatiellales bacterium]
MTSAPNRRAIELAVCLAVMMHLLLFMAVRPTTVNALSGVPVPPATSYLANPSGKLPGEGVDNVRTLWSPVLFSLPTEMGFSGDLLNEHLKTRLTFSRAVESEQFLKIDSASGGTEPLVDPKGLMVTGADIAPPLPVETFQPVGKKPAPRRVYVAPELKDRLVGGVVLPPELNQDAASPWEVRAAVGISKQGVVQHVFLDSPLESAALNRQVLQLLYGLRFSPGAGPVDGSIEIYSSETISAGGAVK